jgi:hypothetical protein
MMNERTVHLRHRRWLHVSQSTTTTTRTRTFAAADERRRIKTPCSEMDNNSDINGPSTRRRRQRCLAAGENLRVSNGQLRTAGMGFRSAISTTGTGPAPPGLRRKRRKTTILDWLTNGVVGATSTRHSRTLRACPEYPTLQPGDKDRPMRSRGGRRDAEGLRRPGTVAATLSTARRSRELHRHARRRRLPSGVTSAASAEGSLSTEIALMKVLRRPVPITLSLSSPEIRARQERGWMKASCS